MDTWQKSLAALSIQLMVGLIGLNGLNVGHGDVGHSTLFLQVKETRQFAPEGFLKIQV